MQLRSALLAATVLATPFAASAQPVTGLYLGAGVGVNITSQEDVKSFNVGPNLFGLGGLTQHFSPERQHRLCGCGLSGLGFRQRAPRRD